MNSLFRHFQQTLKCCPVRYRWYLAIIGVLAGYLLLSPLCISLYQMLLPAPALFTRGLQGVAEGRYDDAEECFRLAQRKAPRWEMTEIALHVFYWHEYHDYPLAQHRFELLFDIPVVNRWMEPFELHWRDARENRAGVWMQQHLWPVESVATQGVAGKLFDDFWSVSPHAVEAMTSALLATQHGDYPQAWRLFAQLEREQPQTFRQFWHDAPLLLRTAARAARQSGHPADAARLAKLYRQQPAFRLDTYNEANIRGHEVVNPAKDAADE